MRSGNMRELLAQLEAHAIDVVLSNSAAALAAMVHRFHYLKNALAAVLVFIGTKIFVADFWLDGDKIPPAVSLGVTFALITAGVVYSFGKRAETSLQASEMLRMILFRAQTSYSGKSTRSLHTPTRAPIVNSTRCVAYSGKRPASCIRCGGAAMI